jgi:hypothetical protein
LSQLCDKINIACLKHILGVIVTRVGSLAEVLCGQLVSGVAICVTIVQGDSKLLLRFMWPIIFKVGQKISSTGSLYVYYEQLETSKINEYSYDTIKVPCVRNI